MQRKKVIVVDNLTFSIGSFSMKEAEELVGKPITVDQVCIGLNHGKEDGDADWTPDRLKAEIDNPTYLILRQEILEFSGMTTEANPTGERKAAPVLSTSAAA